MSTDPEGAIEVRHSPLWFRRFHVCQEDAVFHGFNAPPPAPRPGSGEVPGNSRVRYQPPPPPECVQQRNASRRSPGRSTECQTPRPSMPPGAAHKNASTVMSAGLGAAERKRIRYARTILKENHVATAATKRRRRHRRRWREVVAFPVLARRRYLPVRQPYVAGRQQRPPF